MNSYTNAQPGPGLTVEAIAKVYQELLALQPVAYYHTNKYIPVLDDEQQPCFFVVKRTATTTIFFDDLPPDVDKVFLLHPDNLSHLQDAARGTVRLLPAHKEPTP